MNKKTLKALKGSIQKWECICMGMIEDNGVDNCPLCLMFYEQECQGCPVKKKTGKIDCRTTPYYSFFVLAADEESIDDMVRMLEFLESLLPEE